VLYDLTVRPPRPVQVVAALIRRNGRVLIARRPLQVHLGGLWEFPGGKIEGNESAPDALVREIGEELGISGRVGALYLESTHPYPERSVHLRFFEFAVEGEPVVPAGIDLVWVRPSDLEKYPMPEANRGVVRKLRAE
jgi:8-oxo-dGTP diphosphatase